MDALIACRLEECFGFASIMTLRLPPDEGPRSQAGRSHTNEWLHSISRAGYLIDTLTDLRRDHATGRISFWPTPWEVTSLTWQTGVETLKTLMRTPLGSLRFLGKTALGTLSKPN